MNRYLTSVMGLALALQGCVMNEDLSGGPRYYYHGQDLRFSEQEQLQEIANNLETHENECRSNGSGAHCRIAGIFYTDGKSDHKTATGYFAKSCILKDDIGCRCLGVMFEEGRGVSKDYQSAKEAYELACELSEGYNCDRLANLYYEGLGVRQDFKKAFEIYLKSCDLYNHISCGVVGIYYEFGQLSVVEKDFKKAKEYYGKSCDLGSQTGCDNYRRLNELELSH